jgi:glycosyltransferase involved in cell wall biosynthesis
MNIDLSVIVPVYNRPDEIDELLDSLSLQTRKDFEVVIVEDGSTNKCDKIINKYLHELDIKYFYKVNSGAGHSRNYGFERATGNYCVFVDSDCIIPKEYIEVIINNLYNSFVDAFGGPEKAHIDFSRAQKAINYAMKSFFTMRGIRSDGDPGDEFYPLSFNMGYSREVFNQTGGFSEMRFGGDIDMSIRIFKQGFKTRLIKEAYVFHKRPANIGQFFRQRLNLGIARVNLYKLYPESLKLAHLFPLIFLLGLLVLSVLSTIWGVCFLLPLILFVLAVFIDSTIRNRSIGIGFLSVATSFVLFIGYGVGVLSGFGRGALFPQR